MTIDFIRAPFRDGFFAHLPQRFDRQPNLLFGVGRGEREAKRAAVDGHRGEQRGRDQDAVLPKHVARLDDVGYGADPYADERLAKLAVGHGPEKTAVEAMDSRRFSSSSAQLTKAAIEENAFDMPPT